MDAHTRVRASEIGFYNKLDAQAQTDRAVEARWAGGRSGKRARAPKKNAKKQHSPTPTATNTRSGSNNISSWRWLCGSSIQKCAVEG
jgi:hypothetical protein